MFPEQITALAAPDSGMRQHLPIRTPRLVIREFQLADAKDLYSLHRDARATRYAGGTRTKEQSFSSLCRIINRVRETGFGALAIESQPDGRLIGWGGIQPIPDSDRYELLYALKPEYWGFGLATEAGYALLNAAFNSPSTPLSEVYALVFPQNIGSIRVLEKLGMDFVKYYFDGPTQRHACLYRISQRAFLASAYAAFKSGSSSKK